MNNKRHIDIWINENYKQLEKLAKKYLNSRFGEAISAYYIYLIKKDAIPENPHRHFYYFIQNLLKSRSEINHIPIQLKSNIEIENIEISDSSLEEKRIELIIDLSDDEQIIDFLMNNPNNEKWLKIYEVINTKKLKLDIFEQILFDYVFIKGLSIAKISNITGNTQNYTWRLRKNLIQKIKDEI